MSYHFNGLLLTAATSLGLALTPAAQASVINVSSYNMLNGDGQASGGSYNYWDKSYSGIGAVTTDHSALSGGKGDLTDGVIATQNWFNVENGAGTGPYVGWLSYNPTIDFFFASLVSFTSVTFHFDDSDGAGGVSQPLFVAVNGSPTAVPNNAGPAPFAFTIDLTGLTANQLTVDITRGNAWVFLSEVTFEGQIGAVPLPAGGILLLGALAGLAALRRGRKTGA